MSIINNSILEYLERLKDKSPTPGGGSVSGITAMQAVSLNLMVLNLTIGKKKYAEYESFLLEEKTKNEALYSECLKSADKDIEAYNGFAEAYKLPHNTEDEKKERERAIDKAAKNAILAPIETMKLCEKGLEYTVNILFKTNQMAISDLITAAIMFEASCKSTLLNVKINAKFLQSKIQRDKFLKEADEIIMRVSKMAGDILEQAIPKL